MSNLAKVIVAIAFLIFVMALGYHVAMSNASEDHLRLTRDVEGLRAGNLAIQAENHALRTQIDGLRTDARVIERAVRDDLGLVRRDELLILLNQPETDAVRRTARHD